MAGEVRPRAPAKAPVGAPEQGVGYGLDRGRISTCTSWPAATPWDDQALAVQQA